MSYLPCTFTKKEADVKCIVKVETRSLWIFDPLFQYIWILSGHGTHLYISQTNILDQEEGPGY